MTSYVIGSAINIWKHVAFQMARSSVVVWLYDWKMVLCVISEKKAALGNIYIFTTFLVALTRLEYRPYSVRYKSSMRVNASVTFWPETMLQECGPGTWIIWSNILSQYYLSVFFFFFFCGRSIKQIRKYTSGAVCIQRMLLQHCAFKCAPGAYLT